MWGLPGQSLPGLRSRGASGDSGSGCRDSTGTRIRTGAAAAPAATKAHRPQFALALACPARRRLPPRAPGGQWTRLLSTVLSLSVVAWGVSGGQTKPM
jgi:hypothetical protein